MMRSARTGGALFARLNTRSFTVPRRSFAVSATAKADLVTDMYLKEVKGYKIPPQKESDAEGHVQKFSPPAAPKSPEETNLASEMQEYEGQTVEIEGQAATGETQPTEQDYFEDMNEAEGQEEAHH